MATVKNTITMQDKMTPVLRTIIKSLHSTVDAMAGVDRVSNTAFRRAQKDIQAASEAVKNLNKGTKDLKPPVESVGKKFSNWGANLGGAIYSIKSILNNVTRVANKMDEMNARSARADMVANLFGGDYTGQGIKALTQSAAESSRGNAALMADIVGKMGIQATEAFGNPRELIDFNEQLQKTFVIAGTSKSGVESTMYNLVQALSTGVLRGQDLNAVMSNTPQIVQNIAKYMGASIGEVRKLAEEGMITAEVVKYAMLSASEQTNEAFNVMPMTFQAVVNMIQTEVDNFLQPMAEKMSGFWNFIVDNWSIVKPVLIGITIALGALAVGLGIAAVAQWALNSAMLANPITWIIVAIVALIAIIVVLVLWVMDLWETNLDFKYGVIKIWNSILNFFDKVPIFFQWVGNGIADAFSNAKVKVAEIMQSMANIVINTINKVISALNKIPGVAINPLNQLSFASTLASEEEAKRQSRANSLEAAKSSAEAKAMARQSEMLANRAIDEANLSAKKAEAEAKKNDKKSIPAYEEIAKKGVEVKGGKLNSVGKINDDVSIVDEDIKLLKDIAQTEFINKFTTLRPEMQVSFGDVKETADVTKILSVLEQMVEEAYASVLVGEGA